MIARCFYREMKTFYDNNNDSKHAKVTICQWRKRQELISVCVVFALNHVNWTLVEVSYEINQPKAFIENAQSDSALQSVKDGACLCHTNGVCFDAIITTHITCI